MTVHLIKPTLDMGVGDLWAGLAQPTKYDDVL